MKTNKGSTLLGSAYGLRGVLYLLHTIKTWGAVRNFFRWPLKDVDPASLSKQASPERHKVK